MIDLVSIMNQYPDFTNWFNDYSDNHHHGVWLEHDLYLDEVELPNEFKITLLKKWLSDKHNIHVLLKPVLGSKNGYDSYPLIGWDCDIISNNIDSTNSYYLGYPILEWFTAILDDPNDTLEDIGCKPYKTPEEAIEANLLIALKRIK